MSGRCLRSARPNDPPIRPVPRMATHEKGTALVVEGTR
jgi:hypothetical protein